MVMREIERQQNIMDGVEWNSSLVTSLYVWGKEWTSYSFVHYYFTSTSFPYFFSTEISEKKN